MVKKWFQTWKRPEYREWAAVSKKGYVLVIIRKEVKHYILLFTLK